MHVELLRYTQKEGSNIMKGAFVIGFISGCIMLGFVVAMWRLT